MFMLAGYETTSTALAYSSYVLATIQDEQQKLREEIDSFYPKDSDIIPDTENIKELTYLDMFCKEVLRYYPIARTFVYELKNKLLNYYLIILFSRIRRCVNKTTIKGIDFEPGVCVRVDHLSIHYSEDLWGPTDPRVFNPSRLVLI